MKHNMRLKTEAAQKKQACLAAGTCPEFLAKASEGQQTCENGKIELQKKMYHLFTLFYFNSFKKKQLFKKGVTLRVFISIVQLNIRQKKTQIA